METSFQIENPLGSSRSVLRWVGKNGDIMLAIAVMSVLSVMIIPLPSMVLDILLATNITMSLILLMVSLYLTSPLQLSVFPGLLLILTLFRLSLNVAVTRLVLSEGYAGEVVQAFGSFVVKGNYVVGFVIFIILVVIQFIVIVKGAGRIAEVAARFTLDAMPGKQMAIDADMNAGLITEDDARKRRQDISREAEFYGAMDGASKFVRGDAMAGLIITGVNILGGFVIGMVQKGLPFVDALQRYTLLTVGDGLVSQIPALVVSTSAGMVVTRSASGNQFDIEIGTQLFSRHKALLLTSGTLLFFAIVPGLPTIPFLVLSLVTGGLGFVVRSTPKIDESVAKAAEQAAAQKKPVEEPAEQYVLVDPLELEIGYGLISLVDESQGGDLFQRITSIRKQLAMELGLVIPPIRVRDNLQLEPNQYAIKIRGNIIGQGALFMDYHLAMNPGTGEGKLEGIEVKEPTYGLPAVWIPSVEREQAELMGYTVVEPSAVLSTHLTEVLKRNADRILGRQETKMLIENLKKDYPAVVDDIAADVLPLGTIQKVLQNLLREGIPIRDAVTILEALSDYARITKNVDVLTEYVRHSLSDTISQLHRDADDVLYGIAMTSKLEQVLTSALQNQRDISQTLGLAPNVIRTIHTNMSKNVDHALVSGHRPIVVCAATVRPYFYRLIHTAFPTVAVLSFTELPADLQIEFIGKLGLDDEN